MFEEAAGLDKSLNRKVKGCQVSVSLKIRIWVSLLAVACYGTAGAAGRLPYVWMTSVQERLKNAEQCTDYLSFTIAAHHGKF